MEVIWELVRRLVEGPDEVRLRFGGRKSDQAVRDLWVVGISGRYSTVLLCCQPKRSWRSSTKEGSKCSYLDRADVFPDAV